MHDLILKDRQKYIDNDYKIALKSCATYILELLAEAKAIERYTNDKIDQFEKILSDCNIKKKIENDTLHKVTLKLQRFIEEYEEYTRCYFRCVSLEQFERAEDVNIKGKKIISKIKKYQNDYIILVEKYIKELPCRYSFANLENQESSLKVHDCFSQFMNLRYFATESLIKIDILLHLATQKIKALYHRDFDSLIKLEYTESSYFEENTFFGNSGDKEKQKIIAKFTIPSFSLGIRSDASDQEKNEVLIKPLCYGCTHCSSELKNHTGLCKVTCETCLKGIHRKHNGQCLPKNKKINKSINDLLNKYDIKELSKYFDEDIKVTFTPTECRFTRLPKELFFVLSFFIDKAIILND